MGGRDFEHPSREWRGEWWFLSLPTYVERVVGQEGTAVDVAGGTTADVDGSSVLQFLHQQLVQKGRARDIEQNLRMPGTICAQVIGPQQSSPVHQQAHRSSTYSGVEGRGSGAVG